VGDLIQRLQPGFSTSCPKLQMKMRLFSEHGITSSMVAVYIVPSGRLVSRHRSLPPQQPSCHNSGRGRNCQLRPQAVVQGILLHPFLGPQADSAVTKSEASKQAKEFALTYLNRVPSTSRLPLRPEQPKAISNPALDDLRSVASLRQILLDIASVDVSSPLSAVVSQSSPPQVQVSTRC
jgi:hypothetical protein